MQLRWSQVRSVASVGLFTSTLPFNHVYTYLTAVGHIPVIPLFIGALTYGFLGLTFVTALRDGVFRVREIALSVLPLLSILLVVLFYASFVTVIDSTTDRELFNENVEILLRCFGFILLGYYLSAGGLDRLRRLMLLSWCAMVANVLVNSSYPSLVLRLPAQDELSGLYLFLGDTFAVCSVLCFATLRSTVGRLSVISLSLICLYAIASRTSLYAFLTVVPIMMAFMIADARGVKQRGGMGVALALCIMSTVALIMENLSMLSTRMIPFAAFGEDTSWSYRQWQLREGLAVIRQHPFLGSYGSDYFLNGRFGDYIHSYLEVWRQFGVIPFALVLAAIIVPMKRTIALVLDGSTKSAARASLMLMMFCGIEIAFSRTWGSAYIFLAIGMVGPCVRTFTTRRGRNNFHISKQGSWKRDGGTDPVDPLRVRASN